MSLDQESGGGVGRGRSGSRRGGLKASLIFDLEFLTSLAGVLLIIQAVSSLAVEILIIQAVSSQAGVLLIIQVVSSLAGVLLIILAVISLAGVLLIIQAVISLAGELLIVQAVNLKPSLFQHDGANHYIQLVLIGSISFDCSCQFWLVLSVLFGTSIVSSYWSCQFW